MSRPPIPRRLTDDQKDRVAAHYWLALWGAKRIRRCLPKIRVEESRSLAGEALCLAVIDHDPAKGKLSTYFSWRLRAALSARGYHRRLRGYRHGQPGAPSIRGLNRVDKERFARSTRDHDPHITEEVRAIVGELDPDDRELLRLRYFEDRDMGALGAALGVSRQQAGYRLNRAIGRARDAALRRDNL